MKIFIYEKYMLIWKKKEGLNLGQNYFCLLGCLFFIIFLMKDVMYIFIQFIGFVCRIFSSVVNKFLFVVFVKVINVRVLREVFCLMLYRMVSNDDLILVVVFKVFMVYLYIVMVICILRIILKVVFFFLYKLCV